MYEMYVRVTFNCIVFCVTFHINLWTTQRVRKGTAEGRRRQTLCEKRDNNSVWKQFPPNFTFRLKDLFVKDQNTVVLIEHQHKHAGNRPVTFVTHKRFAVLFFASSCCVSLLNSVLYERKSNCVARENYPTVEINLKIDARCQSQRSSSIIDQERVDWSSIQVPWLSTCGSTAALLASPLRTHTRAFCKFQAWTSSSI